MAAFEDNFTLEIFLNGCFQRQLQRYNHFKKMVTHILHFLLLCHVKEEQIYMDLFQVNVLEKSVST